MASPLTAVVRELRGAALGRPDAAADAELLRRFAQAADEVAFAALVRRHGPMVLGVCRRLLRSREDAEDCFQATFLVLARKARSVREPGSLGSWLYGVAWRVARKARAARARRRAKEAAVAPRPPAAPELPDGLAELLDEEVARLPEKYRAALVRCELQGCSHREAARELGCPEGTIASRLSRARALLARRLAARGLAVPAAALAAALVESSASAAVPAPLVSSTVRAAALFAAGKGAPGGAALLAEGVLKMMPLNRLRLAPVLLLVLGALTAGVAAVGRAQPGKSDRAVQLMGKKTLRLDAVSDAEFIRRACLDARGSLPTDVEVHYFLADRNPQKRAWLLDMLKVEAARAERAKEDRAEEARLRAKQDALAEELRMLDALQAREDVERQARAATYLNERNFDLNDAARLRGTWELVSLSAHGTTLERKEGERTRVTFAGDQATFRPAKGDAHVVRVRLDAATAPKVLILERGKVGAAGQVVERYAYELEGDRLRLRHLRGEGHLPAIGNEMLELRRVRGEVGN